MWPKNTWELIWELARTDFKLRYNGTKIGYMWAVLKPLALFFIINFVFSRVFAHTPNYSLSLLIGITYWSFFAEGTSTGLSCLTNKAGLLSKIALPLPTIILAQLLQSCLIASINGGIVIMFIILFGPAVTIIGWLVALLLFFATAGLILAFTLIAAPLQVRVRDTAQLWDIALRFGFYMAPIIYPLAVIPPDWQKILWLNPMSYIIHVSKEALLDHHIPLLTHLTVISLLTMAAILAASIIFRYLTRNLTDYL